ncbi:DUF2332 domain-containing protein [Roseateles koreensis]|uniref:DUF2332 domain-containing protein n=1 Tax=Roseateles koreensis TaxID=2987526 RepID=A0ABT5KUX7_9BURK|nr:DUF2332 domain-containing protein [Roseateles koreensis]MDC8786616.1 DUF2332 domain-containing protein [Roseateles koreensis]
MPTDINTQARWAQRFRHFAAVDCPQDPLYVALCLAIANTPELLDLMNLAPPTQAKVNLLLAALHERVLAGVPHAMAAYYPSVGGTRLPDEQLPGLLLDFARCERPTIEAHLHNGKTQTNEIGRCAVLWPALQYIARLRDCEALSLIDFGCSAGLNLGVEHYHYRYRKLHSPFSLGAAPGPGVPEIDCDWLGDTAPPPAQPWRMVQRLGLDLSPVDVRDPAALRWLRACLWPHDRERAQRLEQAVALTRGHEPELLQSDDGLGLLATRLTQDPAGAMRRTQPILFNSWVLYYFEPQALAEHRARVAQLILRHDLMWLSAESAAQCPPGLDLPPLAAHLRADAATLWTLQWAEAGQLRQQALAWSHPHGRWVQWLAPDLSA